MIGDVKQLGTFKKDIHTQHVPWPQAGSYTKKPAAKVLLNLQAPQVLLAEIADAEAAKPDHSAGSPAVGQHRPG